MQQTYKKGQLYQISIIDLKPDPNQPQDGNRQLSERRADSKENVKESGLIRPQNFLMVV